MREEKISLKISDNDVKIYINSLLHVQFKCDQFVGIQSWINGTNWYYIKFYLKAKVIECSYSSFKRWSTILELIDKQKL